ncbi:MULTISPECIES: hypothetical protein [unclassified Candidatus Frackibacter]|uniref:hypothetical protein n=1 Tax=unclassified Candidatus Frackibacter TaxID=2648818 RepID=UPI000795C6C1|nr:MULTISPECIES: hypothetical protein [unclassified Candidatus Frackibacter]KXS41566.1 MAG: hypothetical protein AWU54_1592 [Candidatus Frackibacter sp. T328-2]SDC46907.1 hypothetical protein SAMN04515661_11112 [Candidatus Frackibacter sp. WG11]SEM81666.1 hypothetical protein SAMN04488698_11838 [Candidatus Frackibacter sp. WG12]SFL72337.1 hypothetical protein SAMN04488699_11112 [Candidatus Frackibacter sp. WG13]
MKKLGVLFLSALVIALFAIPAAAADATLDTDGTYGIDGSGHDFSIDQDSAALGTTGNGYDVLTGADISCVGCHVPHNTNSEEEGALFSDYYNGSGTTTDAALTPPGKLYNFAEFSTATKLCMSCHDGTMTVPQTAGTTTEDTSTAGNAGGQVTLAENVITRDLNDDHPVGIQYEPGRFRGITTTSWGAKMVDLNPGDESFALLSESVSGTYDDIVSCYTCHDPHLDLDGMAGDEDSFLRVKPAQAWAQSPVDIATFQEGGHAAENLCIQCHQK